MRTPRTSLTGRWIALAGCFALTITLIVQWRAISRLQHENGILRAQPQVKGQEGSTQASTSDAVDPTATEQLKLEILRLRNEVQQLRQQGPPPGSGAPSLASQPAPPIAPDAKSHNDEVRQLGIAAMQGDTSALDKLAKLVAATRTMNTNEQAAIRSDIQSTFEALGAEAGKGNAAGLQALWQASRIKELEGFAVHALGQAAGLGNEEALKPLLDPDNYLLLRSSTVAALKPAADAGNAKAIEALAATAADQKQRALWLLAADGLAGAAVAGNFTAIDSLANLAASEDKNVRTPAVLALEAAARNSQPRAEEALRKLGWR